MTSSQGTCKTVLPKEKVIPEVEYNFVDDLKRAKAHISMFELLKIPSIREILPNNMVLSKSIEAQNHYLEIFTNSESQKYGTKIIPPFLLNFEFFDRNIHNCMIDSGESSYFIPVSVCRNLNATWESCPT